MVETGMRETKKSGGKPYLGAESMTGLQVETVRAQAKEVKGGSSALKVKGGKKDKSGEIQRKDPLKARAPKI